MCNNKQQEKKGEGSRLRKDEVQGCFDGRKKKTSREIPMRTVDDILRRQMLAICLASLLRTGQKNVEAS